MRDKVYLGDGVYASHDGYQVWLSLDGQPDNGHVCKIAMEPAVLTSLDQYRDQLRRQREESEAADA